ncbi:MAG: acylphosphatase [Nitrososphaerales archaeon]|nr:acylphosphatase [Nitrososphaerales archaeon]
MERAKIVAEGDVQGVGYRYYVGRLAWRLDLKGYVTNLPDGRVEVVVEGEKSKIEEFIKAINVVRPPINVTKLSIEYQKPTGKFTTFKIKTGTLREELVEGFSTGASYFEIMFTKQDQMLAKQDQMLALQKQTLDEVKALRVDLKTILDERLKAIECDLTLIKAKLNL